MDRIGLLNICKAPGMSSHEVVARVRRIAGMKRVGHTGTLDPAACGVMIVCLGSATRLADYISAGTKAYRAEFTFGIATDSADAEGEVITRADASALCESDVLRVLPQFTGVIQQRPPAHSAVQIGGRRAYDMIRQGETVEIPLREVTIESFTLARFQPGPHPRALVDIVCSKGTYIRSLARDIGELLGVGAVLSFLARTQVGDSRLEDAITIDELAVAAEANRFDEMMIPADTPLHFIPEVHLPPTADLYRQGAEMAVDVEPGLYRVYLRDRFIGLGRSEAGRLRAVVNFQVSSQ